MSSNPILDKSHKYQLNEAIRADIPNLALLDEPGRVYRRHEVEDPSAKPMYDIIIFKTRGVYRVDEEMIRSDPSFHSPGYEPQEGSREHLEKIARSLAAQFLERDADSCELDDYSEEDSDYIRERLKAIAAGVRRGSAG